jgi:hypothetical protein
MSGAPRPAAPTRRCALCGAPARPPFQAPSPELAPDLDLRPGEPTRSTLPKWIMTCRQCGLSAPDLVEPPARARETMAGAEYQALAGPGPERAVLRYALLSEAAGDRAEAAGAVLQAAWLRDDAGQDAGDLRRRAAALWAGTATMQEALSRVDALRRAGEHEAAGAQAAALLARPELNETDRAVLTYQQDLIAAGDTARHLMSSALRPPAQRPHVTHGRPAAPDPAKAPGKPGFWQRLLGR